MHLSKLVPDPIQDYNIIKYDGDGAKESGTIYSSERYPKVFVQNEERYFEVFTKQALQS